MKIKLTASFIAIILCSLFLAILPKGSFWIRDAGNKFILINNYLSHNVLQEIPYPGAELDKEKHFFPINRPFAYQDEGSFKSQYPFNLYLRLSAFFYKLFGYSGLYMVGFLSYILLSILIIYQSSQKNSTDQAIMIVAVFFSSPLLFYAFTFWEHTFSILLFYSGIIVLQNNKTFYSVISGLLFASSILLREELGILLAAYILSRIKEFKKLKPGKLVLSVIILLFVLLYSDFATRIIHFNINRQNTSSMFSFFYSRTEVFRNLLFNLRFLPFSEKTTVFLEVLLLSSIIILRKRSKNLIFLSYIILFFLYFHALSISSHKGYFLLESNTLLFTFPIFLLSLYNFKTSAPFTKLIFLFIVSVTLLCPLNSSFGVHWGSRMLIGITPFVFLALDRIIASKSISYKILIPFLIVSVILQLYSLHMLYERKLQTEKLITTVKVQKNIPIVTNVPWLAEDLAPIYHKRKIYYISDSNQINKLKKIFSLIKVQKYLLITLQQQTSGHEEIITSPTNCFKSFNLKAECINQDIS